MSYAKGFIVAALALAGGAALWSQAGSDSGGDRLGVIAYLRGSATVTRDGQVLKDIGIGDEVEDEDLIVTGAGSTMQVELDPATAMKGTLNISPNSRFYLRSDDLEGQRKNEVELIAGQIALKVKKLAGDPSFDVSTGTAVAGVRGTEFTVTSSDSGDVLVGCSEGAVSVSDSGGTVISEPGQVVEKPVDGKMARQAVKAGDLQAYQEAWAAKRAEEFRKNAARDARQIIARYIDASTRLAEIHSRLSAEETFRVWNEAGGKPPKGANQAEMAKALRGARAQLVEAAKTLGEMERIEARVEALKAALGPADPALKTEIRGGFTVGDFFARFDAQREKDQSRAAWLRHQAKIYKHVVRQLGLGKGPKAEGRPKAPGLPPPPGPAPEPKPKP